MMTSAELESFFTGIVATAQGRGIVCGITSGMACGHFGVAATTKDCDVLCAADSAADFLALIAATAQLIHPSLMEWLPAVGGRVVLPTP